MSAAKISSSVAPSTTGRCRPPRMSALLNCDSSSRWARGEGATKNNNRVIGTSSGAGSLNFKASRKIKMAKVPASRPSATGVRRCGNASPPPTAAQEMPSGRRRRCASSCRTGGVAPGSLATMDSMTSRTVAAGTSRQIPPARSRGSSRRAVRLAARPAARNPALAASPRAAAQSTTWLRSKSRRLRSSMAGRPSLRTQFSTTLSSTPNDSASWMMFRYMAKEKTSNNQHRTTNNQFSVRCRMQFHGCSLLDVLSSKLILQPSSFFGAAAGGFVEKFSSAFERTRQFPPRGFELFFLVVQRIARRRRRQAENFPGAVQRKLDVGADVFPTEPVEKPRLVHHEQRLRVRPAQNEVLAAGMQLAVKILEGVKSRGVNRQNFSHAQNEHVRLLPGPLQGRFQLVGRAKEKRAEDAINHHTLGNLLADQRMLRAFSFADFVHGGDLRN